MPSMNVAYVLGNLGKDPELTYTQGGTAKCRFSLATTEVFVMKDEKKERTNWHSIVVWGKQGEACAKYLVKGAQALVRGRIENGSYEKDGVTRYTSEIVAESVVFLGGKRRDEGDGGARRGRPADDEGQPEPQGGPAPDANEDDLPF